MFLTPTLSDNGTIRLNTYQLTSSMTSIQSTNADPHNNRPLATFYSLVSTSFSVQENTTRAAMEPPTIIQAQGNPNIHLHPPSQCNHIPDQTLFPLQL